MRQFILFLGCLLLASSAQAGPRVQLSGGYFISLGSQGDGYADTACPDIGEVCIAGGGAEWTRKRLSNHHGLRLNVALRMHRDVWMRVYGLAALDPLMPKYRKETYGLGAEVGLFLPGRFHRVWFGLGYQAHGVARVPGSGVTYRFNGLVLPVTLDFRVAQFGKLQLRIENGYGLGIGNYRDGARVAGFGFLAIVLGNR